MEVKSIMRTLFLCIGLILSFFQFSFGMTSDTKSGTIVIDGVTADFSQESDQILLSPDLTGVYYESDNDSKWGANNDISSIQVTWDRNYFYVGVDGVCENNNIIVYFDTGENNGISDVSSLSSWKRKIDFEVIKPDYFIVASDKNNSPQFWKILSSTSAEDKSASVISSATFNGGIKGAMESRIGWDMFYGLGNYNVATNAVMKIVGVVVGGDDTSGPDAAPNASGTMPTDSSKFVTVDNYLIVPLDNNSDGLPDIGANVRGRTSVAIDINSLKYQPLFIGNMHILNQSFSPNGDGINDDVTLNYLLSKDANVAVRIFNISGEAVYDFQKSAKLSAGVQSIKWDGLNNRGIRQNQGIYIVYIQAESSGVSVAKKVPVFIIQ